MAEWSSFAEWLDMGKYTAFVWPAYIFAIGSLAVLGWRSYAWQRRVAAEAARLRERRRTERKTSET